MSIALPHSLNHRVYQPDSGLPLKTPIVLLHGLMGFAANWGKIWPFLQPERAVLVLDQRGHGRSPKPETGYTPSDYASDILSILDHLNWKECHIVGHSMGGRVALRFACKHPDRVKSLILEDSGMESRPDRLDWIKNLLSSIPTPFPDRERAKEFFEKAFADDRLTGSFLHANLESNSQGQLNWRFHAPGMIETIANGRALDAMVEFASIKAPTLIIRGAKSDEFRADEAKRMAESRSNISLVTIGGAGHFVHAEKPKEFSDALIQFLNKIEKSSNS